MVNLVYCLTNSLFFDIPLLYYYVNVRSLGVCYLISWDIHLSLSSPIFCFSFITVPELFCGKVFETFMILSAILFLIKSPFISAAFKIALFEAVLNAFAAES